MNSDDFLKLFFKDHVLENGKIDRIYVNSMLNNMRKSKSSIPVLPTSLASLYDLTSGSEPLDISYFIDHFDELSQDLKSELYDAISKSVIESLDKKTIGNKDFFEFIEGSGRNYKCDLKHFNFLIGDIIINATEETLQEFQKNHSSDQLEKLLILLSLNNSEAFNYSNAEFLNKCMKTLFTTFTGEENSEIQKNYIKTLLDTLNTLDFSSLRNQKLLLELYNNNILPINIIKDKINCFKMADLIDMYNAKLLSRDSIYNLVGPEPFIECYLNERDDKKLKNYAKQYLPFISVEDLIKSFVSSDEKRIDLRALKSSKITKEDVKFLPPELLAQFLSHPSCPKDLIPDSDDLIIAALMSPNKKMFVDLAKKRTY